MSVAIVFISPGNFAENVRDFDAIPFSGDQCNLTLLRNKQEIKFLGKIQLKKLKTVISQIILAHTTSLQRRLSMTLPLLWIKVKISFNLMSS